MLLFRYTQLPVLVTSIISQLPSFPPFSFAFQCVVCCSVSLVLKIRDAKSSWSDFCWLPITHVFFPFFPLPPILIIVYPLVFICTHNVWEDGIIPFSHGMHSRSPPKVSTAASFSPLFSSLVNLFLNVDVSTPMIAMLSFSFSIFWRCVQILTSSSYLFGKFINPCSSPFAWLLLYRFHLDLPLSLEGLLSFSKIGFPLCCLSFFLSYHKDLLIIFFPRSTRYLPGYYIQGTLVRFDVSFIWTSLLPQVL